MPDLNQLIHTLNWELYAKIGSGIGTGITVIKGLSTTVNQYTKEEKQRREINRATRLMNFINRITQAPERIASKEMNDILPVLDRELKATLTGIRLVYQQPQPKGGLSSLQRAFLLYSPVGVWSWIAHILFYSTAVITVMATYGAFVENDSLSWNAGVGRLENGGVLGLLLFGFIAWISRRWALNRWTARHQKEIDGATIHRKKTPYQRLCTTAWIISAFYVLLVMFGTIGAIQDSDPNDAAPMPFQKKLLIVFLLSPPLLATVGLAIASRRARILERTEKQQWSLQRFFLARTPLTAGAFLAAVVRYLILFAFLVFVFNLDHVIRKDMLTLSDYWASILHEPCNILIPVFLVILPFFAALKWADLESSLTPKKNELIEQKR